MAKKESTTKNFILRMDADLMGAIEKWAADEFRSTNGQLQWIITEALRKNGRMPKKKTVEKTTKSNENDQHSEL
ncbi:MAG TPA: DNA-binding protein [Prevotella sp.]